MFCKEWNAKNPGHKAQNVGFWSVPENNLWSQQATVCWEASVKQKKANAEDFNESSLIESRQ